MARRLLIIPIIALAMVACATNQRIDPSSDGIPGRTPVGSPSISGGGSVTSEPPATPGSNGSVDVIAVADSYGRFDEPGARFNSWPHMQWLAFCAEAFGFETTIENIPGSPASLTAHVNRDQLERWAQVDQMCTEEAARRGWVIPQPRTPEERRAEYRYLLEVNECLTELGHGTDPPSEDAFVEGAEWEVYANTPFGGSLSVAPGAADDLAPDAREQLEIQRQCPV